MVLTTSVTAFAAEDSASSYTAGETSGVSAYFIQDGKAFYGYENSNERVNFMVDLETKEAEFAIVYLNDANTLYEAKMTLDSIEDLNSEEFWKSVENEFIKRSESWKKTNLSEAVLETETSINDAPQKSAAKMTESAIITKFRGLARTEVGIAPYDNKQLTTRIYNKITFKQKETLRYAAYKDKSYLITKAMSITSFITGILGLVASPGVVSAISTICGAAGMLPSGATAVKYRVFADTFRDITANSGSYIYNTTSKHICWDGYYLDKTEGCGLDKDSKTYSYVPSKSHFNSSAAQFDAAIAEYNKVGWQG